MTATELTDRSRHSARRHAFQSLDNCVTGRAAREHASSTSISTETILAGRRNPVGRRIRMGMERLERHVGSLLGKKPALRALLLDDYPVPRLQTSWLDTQRSFR